MKCDYCGSNLTLDDKRCPFCHQPNKHYVKHRQDMFHYETDFQDTKQEVYEQAGKTSRRATRIAVLAVTLLLLLGAVLLNLFQWDIQTSFRLMAAKKNLSTHKARLDAYIEGEDWLGYEEYLSAHDILYYDFEDEEFDTYQQLGRMVQDYTQVYEMCARLVEYQNDEDSFYNPDHCMERIADAMADLYGYENPAQYSYYYDFMQEHGDWWQTLTEQTEMLVQTYVGVEPEVFENKSIRDLSNVKILVLLEGSYEKDE